MNKKKKSTNTSPYPDEAIERLARAFYPAILACWNSEEGQREFAAWQAEQAHHTTSKEKQSVPDGERPVVHIVVVGGFFRVRPGGRTLFLFCPERANCTITYYNPAQPSKCFHCTTTSATVLLWSAHFVNVTAVSYRFPLPPVRTIRWRYPRRALPLPDERTSNRVQHRASA